VLILYHLLIVSNLILFLLFTFSFFLAPDGIYLRVTKDIKYDLFLLKYFLMFCRRLRKEIPQKDIRRIARAPWKKLNTNFVSYMDDDIVVLD
jgi:hypothetical protein